MLNSPGTTSTRQTTIDHRQIDVAYRQSFWRGLITTAVLRPEDDRTHRWGFGDDDRPALPWPRNR